MLQAARPHALRILGPNCIGFLAPGIGLNASFAHLNPNPGSIGFRVTGYQGNVAEVILDLQPQG
jgi:acetyltransferase